jgi:hypothetical protein
VAQASWATWAYPKARGALAVASGVAALAFVPWLPSLADDSGSPTQRIIESVNPFGVDTFLRGLLRWSLGEPLVTLSSLPGTIALILVALGAGAAVAGLSVLFARRPASSSLGLPPRITLVLLLALAAPVGAAVYSLVGDDLFFPRNLIASWPGLALAVGALLTTVPRPFRIASTALVLSAFALGAVRTLDTDVQRPDYPGAAEFVDRHSGPQDPVVDVPLYTPAPVTALQVSLKEPHRFLQFREPSLLGQSLGYSGVTPADFRRRVTAVAAEHRVVVVAPAPPKADEQVPASVASWLPSDLELIDVQRFRGFRPAALFSRPELGMPPELDVGVYIFTERDRRGEQPSD